MWLLTIWHIARPSSIFVALHPRAMPVVKISYQLSWWCPWRPFPVRSAILVVMDSKFTITLGNRSTSDTWTSIEAMMCFNNLHSKKHHRVGAYRAPRNMNAHFSPLQTLSSCRHFFLYSAELLETSPIGTSSEGDDSTAEGQHHRFPSQHHFYISVTLKVFQIRRTFQ